jgi:hypothetical protein
MLRRRFSSYVVSILVVLSIVCQGTLVLAGTTGGLTGIFVDATSKQPIAGAKVTAASPQQIATSVTDSSGHFAFVNLAPDTYTVSAEAQGYQSVSVPGVTVNADNTRVLPITADKSLRTIGRVTTRSASSLVKPGTTSDEYSINPVQQQKLAAAGGGGNLNSAFSALATVPGVTVAPGQSGYIGAGPGLSIRGGDYDQVGYQIDGVPVNRAFDNYPSGSTSSLGQQELQVYTGAPPAGTQSAGVAGYINQVIRTGTSPGFASLDIGAGGPAFYHKLSFEVGGATNDRRFSYYFGLGGYNQDFRYADQYNGAGLSQNYGITSGVPCNNTPTITPAVAPSCYTNGVFNNGYVLLPYNYQSTASVFDRDSIVNLHYYFPHKDGSRDDLQALYDVNFIQTSFYGSTNDQGGEAFLTAIGQATTYNDGYALNLPTGGFLPANYKQYASQYLFPNAPAHPFDGNIDPTVRDGFLNNQAIAKLQFTKSLGSAAYFRVYGYTYYSSWPNSGSVSANSYYLGESGDYELESHTRGVSFAFADQINSQNLLNLGGDFTTASVVRDNNTQYINGAYGPDSVNPRTQIGVLVNSSDPTNGICYASTGLATPCYRSTTGLNSGQLLTSDGIPGAQWATIQQAYNGTIAPVPAGTTCGGSPCQYLVTGNGQYATYSTTKPIFWGASLTDEFRPTPKLTINGGLRLDVYQFQGANTSGGPAREFWYNAYNREMCIDNATGLVVDKIADLGDTSVNAACGTGYSAANFQNPAGVTTQTYPVFQPRLGFTYSVDPSTVLRGAYGRFAEPPNSAFEQYDFLQANAPVSLYGTYGFQQYGYDTPNHPIPPATSSNYDFSIEHQFPGQLAVKLSPFIRKTQNQSEQFFLNRATNFVSGLNVGNQTSEGAEFELDKGNFANEGLSAKLSFAYTHSYIKYDTLSNGTTVLTPIVTAITQYNALTKAGGGAPCYSTTGAKDPTCPAGSVANPYYNAPLQDPNAYSATTTNVPYDTIPAGIGLDAYQIGYPYVGSFVVNERVKKFSVTPIVQVFAGQRYGDPLATSGIDPTTCTGVLAGTTANDPRYPYGAQGGSPYDATTCGQLANGIPDVQTGLFDGIGAFSEPALLLMHVQLAYDVTKNLTITADLANVVNTCFGGSNVPWKVAGACQYTYVQQGYTGGVGNTYNPGQAIQPSLKYSYGPNWTQQPFGVYVNANVKL